MLYSCYTIGAVFYIISRNGKTGLSPGSPDHTPICNFFPSIDLFRFIAGLFHGFDNVVSGNAGFRNNSEDLVGVFDINLPVVFAHCLIDEGSHFSEATAAFDRCFES